MNSENNTNRPFRLSDAQILHSIKLMVSEWENGTACSPSTSDFARIIGRDFDVDFCDELFEFLCSGADEQATADFLWERQP
jgi:hypothetical protein